MHRLSLAAALLIASGAVIMALNIRKSAGVMTQLKGISQRIYLALRRILVINQALIIIFFIGYIAVLAALYATKLTMGNVFVSLIFFFGAIFVYLGIVLQKNIIKTLKDAFEDIVISNARLDKNQTKLAQANAALSQEIEKQQETQAHLSKSYDTQTVVNKILKIAMTEASISEIIDHSLDLVLSLPWISFKAQGSIFLVGKNKDELMLKARRGFGPGHPNQCGKVPFGKCLCGIAASSQTPVFATSADSRHEITIPETEAHGHYCIPILAQGRVLGVINVHIPLGREREPLEEEFLKAVANTLALVLMQRYGEERNEKMRRKTLQSQKMESIGTLAGGIAHDFNNILSGIFGYINLAEMNIENPKKAKKQIEQIYKGARRATDLVQQILTFTRQAENKKIPIKPYLVTQEALQLLRSSIPATIEIQEKLESRSKVLADPTHIHQIVMNLCTNAFHAMRETGGTLTVTLEDVSLPDVSIQKKYHLPQGAYIQFKVKDTGCGMAPEVQGKIFEPYFTTKKMGEGTGLGLAMIAGIVEDHGGVIKVESAINQGTTVRVFLPLFEAHTLPEKTEREIPELLAGNERILIVEDDDSVRTSVREILKDNGYEATAFSNGALALEALKKNPLRYDLIITDITMPQMTGDRLINAVLGLRSDLPVIVCSGYSPQAATPPAPLENIRHYFQKPVAINDLLLKIRQILDNDAPGGKPGPDAQGLRKSPAMDKP